MTADRLLRDRLGHFVSRANYGAEAKRRIAPGFAGQVLDGGSLSKLGECYCLVHPLILDGDEAEGSVPTVKVDTRRKIPVVVLGFAPQVGDNLIAYSIGGRWVSDGKLPPPNCQPKLKACPSSRYAVNGTVTDPINGVQPMVFDFGAQAWFSPWLPFTTAYALFSGFGVNPCAVGTGISYYFYSLTPNPTGSPSLVAKLFLPGQSCTDVMTGHRTAAFFYYPGPFYPGVLNRPAVNVMPGFTLASSVDPVVCDPLEYTATFSGINTPLTSATFSIPAWAPTSYGWTCALPCPLPRKNLTVSWVNTGGNGSGTLTYNAITNDWTMACQNGLTVRLYATGPNRIAFSVTVWSGPDCSGTASTFNYPVLMTLISYTCDPLDFVFTVIANGSLLYTSGYRSFTVTL